MTDKPLFQNSDEQESAYANDERRSTEALTDDSQVLDEGPLPVPGAALGGTAGGAISGQSGMPVGGLAGMPAPGPAVGGTDEEIDRDVPGGDRRS